MPIRASERHRYPKDFRVIRASIVTRSGMRCECAGECGLHHDRRCSERHGAYAEWAKGLIVLTVAHLDHQPENCADDNLKAMCQRCHLRYDREQHQRNAAATRRSKKHNHELPLEADHD